MLGPVELVDEVDSTNRVLLDRARAGAPHGLVLVADHQTAGRGRLGRTWEAEPGAALLVSVLLRPEVPADRVHLLTLAAALAARESCVEVASVTPSLKWPNDLVVERDGETLKLAGLLAESIVDGDRIAAVVVGMGLNLQARAVPDGAIALESLAERSVDRDAVVESWLRHLDERIEAWDAPGIVDDFRRACTTIDRDVHVSLSDSSFDGRAAGLDTAGHLLVETAGGMRLVTAGDVVHVRGR